MTERTKYPVKTSLELTEDQAKGVTQIADHLSAGRPRRVSKKAVHRRMVDHCLECPLFLADVSMDRPQSTE